MNVHQDGLILDRVFPFQIDAVTLAAGDNADDAFHWHSFLEVTCILEGSGCYYVSDRAYEVSPGDIILFNSAELHGWQVFQREMPVWSVLPRIAPPRMKVMKTAAKASCRRPKRQPLHRTLPATRKVVFCSKASFPSTFRFPFFNLSRQAPASSSVCTFSL